MQLTGKKSDFLQGTYIYKCTSPLAQISDETYSPLYDSSGYDISLNIHVFIICFVVSVFSK